MSGKAVRRHKPDPNAGSILAYITREPRSQPLRTLKDNNSSLCEPEKKRERLDCDECDKKPCLFCGKSDESELGSGKLIYDTKSGISIHQFCMYFSSNLSQVGDEDDPLNGFLAPDVLNERKRGSRLKCVYCKKTGATVGCTVASCRRTYHFLCGRVKNTFNEFFGSFRSFCPEHAPDMDPSKKNILQKFPDNEVQCAICLENVALRDQRSFVLATCCKGGAFHVSCIQNYALKAGTYHLQCPLCMSKTRFKRNVLASGIYVPIRDAQWELDGDFNDIRSNRPKKCSAPKCVCPKGESFKDDGGVWHLVTCKLCGSTAAHIHCARKGQYGQLTRSGQDYIWACDDCDLS